MLKYTRRLGAPIALATVTLLGACRSDAKKTDSTALGADSASFCGVRADSSVWCSKVGAAQTEQSAIPVRVEAEGGYDQIDIPITIQISCLNIGDPPDVVQEDMLGKMISFVLQ